MLKISVPPAAGQCWRAKVCAKDGTTCVEVSFASDYDGFSRAEAGDVPALP